MRIIFLFGNILALFGVGALVFLNLSYKPSPPDQIVKNTPDPEEFNAKGENYVFKASSIDFSKLLNDNLFSPYRMREDGDAFSSLKVTGLELIGVISYGDSSGAIIVDKSGQQTMSFQGNRLASSIPNANNKQSRQVSGRPQFYSLNDVLPNGFILKEVNSDSVLLSRGREQVVLQLDFDDEGTKVRTDENRRITAGVNSAEKQVQESKNNVTASGSVVIPPPKNPKPSPSSLSSQAASSPQDSGAGLIGSEPSTNEESSDKKTEQSKQFNKSLPRPGEILK